MSYTPTEWVTGDIVTSEKLNKLENAVANGVVPEYTSADKGKVLTVVDAEPTVIVPEQMVTLSVEIGGPAILENADASYFVVGQTAVMKIDGNSYNVTAEEQEGIVAFRYATQENQFQILYLVEPMGGFAAGIYFSARLTGEYTVSLEIPSDDVTTVWKANSSDLPPAPTEDGVYSLVVADGIPSWEQNAN